MAPLLRCERRPHVLAVPIPFQGHIQPLLALSQKLSSAGIMVTFANTHTNHQRITAHHPDIDKTGIEEGEVESDLLRFVSLGEDLQVEREDPVDTVGEVMKPPMKAAVARLLEELNTKEPPVSVLAFDFRFCFLLDLAIAAGIHSLSLWTQNAASFACNAAVSQGLRAPADESKLFMCARGVPPLIRKDITGLFLETMPPPFPCDEYAWLPFRRSHEPTWLVINTFEELEVTTMETLEEILGFRPLALGPLVNASSFNVTKGVAMTSVLAQFKWLERHPNQSVLYIAFGTLVGFSEVQLEELVLGLEATRQPFMWVFRPGFCFSKKYTLDSLSDRFGIQGLVVPWTPQRQVLSHRAIGGFLTHCGWNSSIEGIISGVPMLTWPHLVDQFLNKRCMVEQWSIGLGFDEDDDELITRREVEKKVKAMMQGGRGEELRENAKKLSALALSALEEGGSSHRQLSHLMNHIWSFMNK